MKNVVLMTALAVCLAATATVAQAADQATAPAAAQTTQAPPPPPPMPASPAGSAATQVGGKWVEEKPGADPRYREGKWIVVEYNRPILRGRQNVFGSGAEYGKKIAGGPVWRAGANQTTRLKTEVPLVIGGKTLAAGEYSVFVDLKEGAWTLILSTQGYQQKYDRANKADTWGSYGYDAKFDVLRAPMTVSSGADAVDQFTIGFVNMTQQGGTLAMWWDKSVAKVDFKVGQ